MNAPLTWRQRHLSKPILNWYRKLLPPTRRRSASRSRPAPCGGTPSSSRARRTGSSSLALPAAALSRRGAGVPRRPGRRAVRAWSTTGRSRTSGRSAAERSGSSSREQGFFGMIIPKSYGGLGFSALAHAAVVDEAREPQRRRRGHGDGAELARPGGAAAALRHRRAEAATTCRASRRGEEIPCFALTEPEAGSDAGGDPDDGHRVPRHVRGQAKCSACALTWNKRYITLAPVATVLGLAFRLHDPDQLLGDKEDLGITLRAGPDATRRASRSASATIPLGMPFQNGPTRARTCSCRSTAIIGGPELRRPGLEDADGVPGRGPRDLAAGAVRSAAAQGRDARRPAPTRASASSSACRSASSRASRSRSRGSAATATSMDAARVLTAGAIDAGEKPSVLSAIAEVLRTERDARGRQRRDGHPGRRGHLRGPRNMLARGYQALPIGDHGRGREHPDALADHLRPGRDPLPSVSPEGDGGGEPARSKRSAARVRQALWAHMGRATSNVLRSFWHNLTFGE